MINYLLFLCCLEFLTVFYRAVGVKHAHLAEPRLEWVMPAQLGAPAALVRAGDTPRFPGGAPCFLLVCHPQYLQEIGPGVLPRVWEPECSGSICLLCSHPCLFCTPEFDRGAFFLPKLRISGCFQKVLEVETVVWPRQLDPGLAGAVQDLREPFADVADLQAEFKGFHSEHSAALNYLLQPWGLVGGGLAGSTVQPSRWSIPSQLRLALE